MGLPRSSAKAISAIMLTVICGTAATGYAAPAREPAKEAPKTDPSFEELRKRGNKASERVVQAAFMGAPGGGGMMFMGRF